MNTERAAKAVASTALAIPWQLLQRGIPKKSEEIVISAFPDYDDATRALLNAASKRGYRTTVLVGDDSVRPPRWCQGAEVYGKYSAKGLWAYHRASLVFTTHGCFKAMPISPRQRVVNVWHGMPVKRLGLLDGKSKRELGEFHYTLANNEFFRNIISACFGVPLAQVLVAMHPRLDVLLGDWSLEALGLPPHRYLAIWLPTYRTSVSGDIRVDGSRSGDIFESDTDLAAVNACFAKLGIVCVVKPHPMTRTSPRKFAGLSSFHYVDDDLLRAADTTLYQMLSRADFLITDISSVYFDFKALNRPIIPYCEDLESYRKSRGFTAPLEQLIDEPFAVNAEQLIERTTAIVSRMPPLRDAATTAETHQPAHADRLFQLLETAHLTNDVGVVP